MRFNPLFSRSNTGGCLAAAMLNALRDLKGDNVANVDGERMGDSVSLSFASAVEMVRSCGRKVDIWKENMGNVDAMEWLGIRLTGAYLFHFKQH